MIEIPRLVKPTSGLVRRKGMWYAVYYVDSKTRMASLDTADDDEAKRARDAFFRSLANQGAKVRSVRRRALEGEDCYIQQRPAFVVRVPGRKLRYAASIEQAREIRDELLNAIVVAPATLEPESKNDVVAG